jgi:HPt (histidine-containing phosphotransfer) domain-containing protein
VATEVPPAGRQAETRDGAPTALDATAVDRLMKVVGGKHESLVELINSFLTDGPALLAEMRKGLGEHDVSRLRRAAHTLKSNSADFGATALQDQARALEERAREGSIDADAPGLVAAAEAAFAAVVPELEAIRDRRAGR